MLQDSYNHLPITLLRNNAMKFYSRIVLQSRKVGSLEVYRKFQFI